MNAMNVAALYAYEATKAGAIALVFTLAYSVAFDIPQLGLRANLSNIL